MRLKGALLKAFAPEFAAARKVAMGMLAQAADEQLHVVILLTLFQESFSLEAAAEVIPKDSRLLQGQLQVSIGVELYMLFMLCIGGKLEHCTMPCTCQYMLKLMPKREEKSTPFGINSMRSQLLTLMHINYWISRLHEPAGTPSSCQMLSCSYDA